MQQLCNDFSLCRIYIKNGCLRSFDRRPAAATSANVTQEEHQAQEYIVEQEVDISQHSIPSSNQGDYDDNFDPFENMDWKRLFTSLT